jgi:hypothetical protein
MLLFINLSRYGHQSTLCDYLAKPNSTLFTNYANFVNNFYSPVYLGGDVMSYSREHVSVPRASANRACKCS